MLNAWIEGIGLLSPSLDGTANMSMSMLHIASSRARLAARSMGAASEGESGVVSQRDRKSTV